MAISNLRDPGVPGNGIAFALDARGNVLDRIDVGSHRHWGSVVYANMDDDPQMEIAVTGGGGMDVIETSGFGPNTEIFMDRRSYQRNDVLRWSYEDSYFMHRGEKQGVNNQTDDLVLEETRPGSYWTSGSFITEPLTLPTNEFIFDAIVFESDTPPGTSLKVNILDASGAVLLGDVTSGQSLVIGQTVKLQFLLAGNRSATPSLDSYRLSFDQAVAREPGPSP